ncbi:MAG TPA: hypothetical protein VKK79_22185 [Candidatus Lokiarchaeia archaeon]|nr:hypothetical protein [Candidatus Lokiarchaeia archaeon]
MNIVRRSLGGISSFGGVPLEFFAMASISIVRVPACPVEEVV